jgi:exosortase A-associated hydrolase 1/exosortase A-associated hydrolase 2
MGRAAPAEPFFLETADGARFCLFHPPAGACRGALVYLHPFAEELNRTRRMAAVGARRLAAQGVAVLQIDLHGCGDSAGDFGDASWDSWKRDTAAAVAWLRARMGCPVGLWGLRLGALLALDCARDPAIAPDRLLLWQPVTNGANYLTQFLRLRLAGDLLQEKGEKTGASTETLRAQLRAGESLEVAGYRLAPALALPVDALDGAKIVPPCPVHWCELTAAPDRPLPPASARVAAAWREQGARVDVHLAQGPQFWATPEIEEAPGLADTTAALWDEVAPLATQPGAQPAPAPAGEAAGGSPRALSFRCHDDWLYGVLDLPAQPRGGRGVLIVVGGPQYRAGSHRQFTLLARRLANEGIPAMRFDYRGMGDSEGEIRNFEQVRDDLRAAVDQFMAAVPGLREVVLWGLCDGASASTLYAPLDARVTGLALLNPWVRTEEGAAKAMLKHYYKDRLLDPALWKKIASGQFDYAGAARSFFQLAGSALSPRRAEPNSAEQEQEQEAEAAPLPERMQAALSAFRGRVLVMLSGADLTAQEFGDVAGGSRPWRDLMASNRVTRHTLPGADHTCSQRPWQDQVEDWTCAWLNASGRP